MFHGNQKLIHSAIALPAIAVGPVKPNAAISADASGFALALGALTAEIAAPPAGPQGKVADAAVPLPEGQDLAEAGKELPDAVLGLEGKSEDRPGAEAGKDDDAGAEDAPPPPFAWFAVAPVPAAQPETKAEASATISADGIEAGGKRVRRDVQAPALPIAETAESTTEAKAEAPIAKPAAAAPGVTTPVAPPEAKPQPATRRAEVQRQPKTDAAAPVGSPSRPVAADPAEAPAIDAAAARATTGATADPTAAPAPQPSLAPAPRELHKAAAEAPVIRITRDAPAPQQKLSIADLAPAPAQPAAAAPAPQSVAEQVFAAFDLPRAHRTPANPANDAQVDLATVAAPATGAQTAAAVTATGQGQDAQLDTRHQEWTAKMIDKIEALQGGGPVRETRLSLMPEGLGKVDIAIRQDDSGSLHVAFNTDTQSARQLIADAQPKLAEIAQERGIRIGSTSVESNAANTNGGTGTGANAQMSQGQHQDARPQRNQPSAPPSARREAQTSTHDDERVA